MVKKVYIQAYMNFNLGDDLFVRKLAQRYSSTLFFIRCDIKYKKIFKDLNNIKIIPLDKESDSRVMKNILNKINNIYINKSDIVIYIGGSIFMEFDTWKNMLIWYDNLFSLNKTYVIGANFGPYRNHVYKEEMGKLFYKLKDLCFRDRYSYNLFKENKHVRYAPDILFSFDWEKNIIKSKKKKLFISIIDTESRNSFPINLKFTTKKYKNLLMKLITIYNQKNYQIVLSSFCKEEHDEEFIQQLLLDIPKKIKSNIKVINYDGYNWCDILNEINSSDYVVATRFHCVIFALLTQTPVLPIIYSNKTKCVLEDLGFMGHYIKMNDITGALDDDFLIYNEIKNIVLCDKKLNYLKKESLKHFEKIDLVLKGR